MIYIFELLYKLPMVYGIIILIFIPVYTALREKAPGDYGQLFFDTALWFVLGAGTILMTAWVGNITPPVWNDEYMVGYVREMLWGHILPLFVLPLAFCC